jgi:hypothetical protein
VWLHGVEVLALQLSIAREAETLASREDEKSHRVVTLEIDP